MYKRQALKSPVTSRLLAYSEGTVNRALFQALGHPARFAVAHVLLTQRSNTPVSSSSSEWNGLRVSIRPDGSAEIDPAQRSQLQAFWRGTLGY